MDNLQRRPSGVDVTRLAVPARLRLIVGAREFIASTKTRHLAMAKLVASEQLARWRQQLLDLDRLTLGSSSMDQFSIIRIADGHPLLHSGGHLPLSQAAFASGLAVTDLLRMAADGRLSLYARLTAVEGTGCVDLPQSAPLFPRFCCLDS